MTEIWKPINGYEGKYEISNLGRIKSYAQDRTYGKIKTGNTVKRGYKSILLYDNNGNKKWRPVHKLVAETFLPNPCGYDQVNHKDENKANNCVENLEWCDNRYNHNYGTRNFRVGLANRCCKTTSEKVYSIDMNGIVSYYDSIGEAERQTGLSHSNIVRTLKGRSHMCGGRQWFYC